MQPTPPNDPAVPDGLTRVDAAVEGAGAPTPAPAARRGRKAVVIAVASVVGLAGIAAASSFAALRGSSETLMAKLPADADLVATAYLDPAASQKVNLFRLTSSFPSLGDESQVTGRAGAWVDSVLAGAGLTHDDLGWVGSQVAVAVDVRSLGLPSVALMLDTRDEGAAQIGLAALRGGPMFRGVRWTQEDHGGVEAWVGSAGFQRVCMGIVDGTVVIANGTRAFDDVVATAKGDAPALADDQDFVDTMAGLPDARLGMIYVAPSDLLDVVDRMGGARVARFGTAAGADLDAVRGIGVAISAEPDAIAIDTEMTVDPSKLTPEQLDAMSAEDHDNALLRMVPADALGFAGLQHLGSGLDAALTDLPADQRAALERTGVGSAISSLTGDLAAEVSMPQGSSVPSGAVMLGTDDGSAMADALQLAAAAVSPASMFGSATATIEGDHSTQAVERSSSPRWKTVDHDGVTVSYLSGAAGGMGVAPAYAVFDGIGLIASSKEEAFRVIDAAHGAPNAMDAERVASALSAVPDSEGLVYADLAAIVQAVGGSAVMDPEIQGDLDALQTLVAGSQNDPQHQHARLVLRIG